MRLTHRRATLRLAEPFRISRETSVAEDVLWVEVAHDGVTGFGEAQPQAHYDESVAGAEAFLDEADGGCERNHSASIAFPQGAVNVRSARAERGS